jgi:hypothetical protein
VRPPPVLWEPATLQPVQRIVDKRRVYKRRSSIAVHYSALRPHGERQHFQEPARAASAVHRRSKCGASQWFANWLEQRVSPRVISSRARVNQMRKVITRINDPQIVTSKLTTQLCSCKMILKELRVLRESSANSRSAGRKKNMGPRGFEIFCNASGFFREPMA